MSRPDNLGKDAAIETIIRFVQTLEPAPIWSEWYVGITADPKKRLYEEHKAPFTRSIYIAVESEGIARSVEKFLIESYGMAGNPGGGENPRFVYAFKKTATTDPPLDNRARE